MAEGVHVVWFKRDLRTRDHEPLQRALQAAAHSGGKVLLLQVFEPGLLAHPTTSSRHVQFQWECGDDIQFTLKQEGWVVNICNVKGDLIFVHAATEEAKSEHKTVDLHRKLAERLLLHKTHVDGKLRDRFYRAQAIVFERVMSAIAGL